MPRGQKTRYTGRQRRLADQIEAGYRRRGIGKREAERRAWATINKMFGGGEKPGGAGHGRAFAGRSAIARKAARTRARKRKRR